MSLEVTTNKNMLPQFGMSFTLRRTPNVSFYCQQANIPGVNLGVVEIPTPFNKFPLAGDTVTFNEFTMTFIISEDFENYLEVYNWLRSLGFPEKFEEYQRLSGASSGSAEGLYSDGSLIIMNSAMNPNFEITYSNMLPITLSDITFDTTQADLEYLTCTASFRYQDFKIRKIT
jgi:hypothetical protein